MRYLIRIVVVLVLLAALFAFACTFTVRFTETAVVTRFGKAGDNAVKNEPGLYFKWFYPLESVTKYDTRVRTLPLKLETQQTADSKQVAVEAFANWRVEDPLKFFRNFSNAGERADDHYRKAEESLTLAMRSALGVVSTYTMDDLFTSGPQGSRLPDLEARILSALNAGGDKNRKSLADFGVAVTNVGLMRIVLPEETTKAVFDRMKATRAKIATEIESRGNSEADAIRARAESDARIIRDFADRLAKEIRTRGDREAVPFIAQMQSNPDLAVFLATTDFLREAYSKRTTLVLAADIPGIRLLFPDALDAIKRGEIPSPTPQRQAREGDAPKANAPAALEGGR